MPDQFPPPDQYDLAVQLREQLHSQQHGIGASLAALLEYVTAERLFEYRVDRSQFEREWKDTRAAVNEYRQTETRTVHKYPWRSQSTSASAKTSL